MNTRFFLKDQKGNIYINVDVTGNGLRQKLSTGILLNSEKDWNPKSNELRGNDLNAIACNKKLQDIQNTVKELATQYALKNEPLTPEILKKELLEVIAPHRAKVVQISKGFTNLIDQVQEYQNNRPIGQADNTYRDKCDFLKVLKLFAKKYGKQSLDYVNIGFEFEEAFMRFLYEEKKYAINSANARKSLLKTFLFEATKNRWNTNRDFEYFKCVSEQPDTIALTEEEVDALDKLKNLTPVLERSRDAFVFTCLTGLRFGDTMLFNPEQRGDKSITFKAEKTGEEVTMYLRKRAGEILDKYNNKFPKLYPTNYNEDLKVLASKIPSLSVLIEKHTNKGGIKKTEKIYKCDLVTAHTGRRTFATNAVIRGMSIPIIMSITGHRTEKAFKKYVRFDKLKIRDIQMNDMKRVGWV